MEHDDCRLNPWVLGIPKFQDFNDLTGWSSGRSLDFNGFLSKILAITALEASTDAFEAFNAFDAICEAPRTSHDQGLCHPSGSLASTPGGFWIFLDQQVMCYQPLNAKWSLWGS